MTHDRFGHPHIAYTIAPRLADSCTSRSSSSVNDLAIVAPDAAGEVSRSPCFGLYNQELGQSEIGRKGKRLKYFLAGIT